MDLSDTSDTTRLGSMPPWGRRLSGALLLAVALAGCSTPRYQALDHDTDLAGAYASAFAAACDLDCGSGRFVYIVVSPDDEAVTNTIVESTPAAVTTAISPIAVRDGLEEGDVATVFTVETAVLVDDVAIIRIGRSEVTTDISTYIGRDYLMSLETDGRWLLRTSEDTGITTTTAIS